MRTCQFPGCDRKHAAKGWCSSHYRQVCVEGREPTPIAEKKNLHARLWSRVDKSGKCWLWQGATNDRGYGLIGAGRKNRFAYVHRLSYIEHHGQIPDGQEVCHTCDNPVCVNPKHLFAGTHLDNMEDMARKGRANRVLSEELVLEVVRLREAGVPRREIVESTGIKLGTLKDVLKGKSWKHVTGGKI